MVFEKQNEMTGREKILTRIKANQPKSGQILPVNVIPSVISDPLAKFKEVLISIGGSAIEIQDEQEIVEQLASVLPGKPDRKFVGPSDSKGAPNNSHTYQDTDVAILRGEFAVAENGAIWITDKAMIDRALPFICSHLVLIIHKSSIVSTMHDAYEKIAGSTYELGTFIAGPSKTADIEQSLVLGAHGAKTLTCFIVK